MKKSLFLLPLLAGLVLVGCDDKKGNGGNNGGNGGGNTPAVVDGEDFVIDASCFDFSDLGTSYTYFTDVVTFEAGGVDWQTSPKGSDGKGTFGKPSSSYNPDLTIDLLQLKASQAGYMENTTGVKGFTEIEIVWYATFSSEDTQYFPAVYAGNEQGPTSKATCQETAKLNGTKKTDFKFGKETDEEKKRIPYEYTTHYTVSADDAFFKIASGSSASYIYSVSFKK